MSDSNLGQKIRELRLIKQMTQKELAGSQITRNMLSQIESGSATPSVKTLEYLAGVLGKPVGYFIDTDEKEDEMTLLIKELIGLKERGNLREVAHKMERLLGERPNIGSNAIIMDLYINTHMMLGHEGLRAGNYDEAIEALRAILTFERPMLLMNDCYLYKVYSFLSEAYTYKDQAEEAKAYNDKAKMLVDKISADRKVQSLYMKWLDEDYDGLVDAFESQEHESLDAYNLARYKMIQGNTFFKKAKFQEAAFFLEQALDYFEEEKIKSLADLVCHELSKCYSELEDYKKAFSYLEKATNK